jgi:DNA-binding transcriptional ArsR family regulator
MPEGMLSMSVSRCAYVGHSFHPVVAKPKSPIGHQTRNCAVTLSVVEVFAALADPARREVMSALARGDLSAGEVAALFPISRPAVSRHLRVLREAGLVHDELVGRRRVYRLDLDGLAPVTAWLTTLASRPASESGGWPGRLDALETEVRRTRRERRTASQQSQKETA